MVGPLALGALVSIIQNNIFEECMETNCPPEFLPVCTVIGGFIIKNIAEEPLFQHLLAVLKSKE